MAICCQNTVKLVALFVGVVYDEQMKNGSRKLENDVAALTIRVPRDIVIDIDSDRIARSVRVPRNTWILEALVEKLQRDRKNGQKEKRNGAK
jgi:hypothetical protein